MSTKAEQTATVAERVEGSFYLSPSIINKTYCPDVRKSSRTKEAIEAKKRSILRLGQIAPIGVMQTPEGEWAVKFGRTRLEAMIELEQEGLPEGAAIDSADIRCEQVADEFDDLKAKVVALAENTGSTPLTGIEIGERIVELEENGYKLKDISEAIGLSQSQCRIYRDAVTEAAPEIQKLIAKGEISPSTVQKLVAKGSDGQRLSHEEQVKAIQPLLDAGKALSRDVVQEAAAEAKAKKGGEGPSGARTGQALDKYFLTIIDTEDPETSKHGKELVDHTVRFLKDFIKFRQGVMSTGAFTNRLFKALAGPQAK